MKINFYGRVTNLTPEEKLEHKLWKLNYLYRVWYGAIPGLPNDQVVIGKIHVIFESLFPAESEHKLGEIYNEKKQIVAYNDLENYLNAETGLIENKRFRILREFKNKEDWYTVEEINAFHAENFELYLKNRDLEKEGLPQDETVTRYAELRSMQVFLSTIDNNSLHFGIDTVKIFGSSILGAHIVKRTEECRNPFTNRLMNDRFKNIQDLLRRTVLPKLPSNKVLPKARVVSSTVYQKFLNDCPSYMSEYKEKLVINEEDI